MMVYLDNNATTRVAPAVFEAMVPWLTDEYGNPSSAYPLGRRAAEAIEGARASVAALVGGDPSDLIFTASGTESLTTAILSCLALDPDRRHLITSTVEHSATIKLCERLARRGYEITWLPVDPGGRLAAGQVLEAVREDTALVSLLWANNETGVIFPIEEIAPALAARKIPLHVDAVQACGKLRLPARDLGIPFLSLSGHKLHAPKGVGALLASRRVRFTPLFEGSQESSRRAGTQNVASIVAFGKAAEIARGDLESAAARIGGMRDTFERHILDHVPGAEVNGDPTARLPNTTNIAFEGIESEGALLLLGERGLACSAGSACTTGSVSPSHVLRAMGMSEARARASLRFSFGRLNSAQDLDAACVAVPEVIAKLRASRPTAGPVLVAG